MHLMSSSRLPVRRAHAIHHRPLAPTCYTDFIKARNPPSYRLWMTPHLLSDVPYLPPLPTTHHDLCSLFPICWSMSARRPLSPFDFFFCVLGCSPPPYFRHS